jgi:hypothetical protein
VISASDHKSGEIYAYENGQLRALTHHTTSSSQSYQKDRMERYLAWCAKYLTAPPTPATGN